MNNKGEKYRLGNKKQRSLSGFHLLISNFPVRILLSILSLIVISVIDSNAQSKIDFNGYIKELSMYYKPVDPIQVSETKTLDNLILNQFHNRLNFKWYASSNFTFALEARNRLFFGQMIKDFPEYKDMIEADNGLLDLGAAWASGNGWLLHSVIDRAWVDYTSGKLQLRLGRQRINWGTNLVWNPNDVFNTFSYFDFDYEERPGTDGIRMQYYTSETSSAELVYKIGQNSDEAAVAGMYRFSKLNYDIQFLGGWVGPDYVLGGGWSGDIKGGGFRGEATWFKPRNNDNSENFESFVASVSGDYTFRNSLYLHAAVLFNSHGTTGDAGGRSFFATNISAKMLSFGRYNLFAQTSYPITPLFSGTIAGMLNPCDGSSYIGPSLTYSIGNNWEVMLNGQLFFGREGTEYGDYGQAVFARIKWSF
ncbi:hypothetical protein [Maribellus sp. YY47]|uniref:hypothetical protein n=1 Tax=Maribellus sp. YY47 TaxID=2929486 RepID=UPI002001CAF8|nr:hypothetical protein [Maribellus sp. YY47]MCK3684182.1 hypothetical protein [Maribellus sp. YY47]